MQHLLSQIIELCFSAVPVLFVFDIAIKVTSPMSTPEPEPEPEPEPKKPEPKKPELKPDRPKTKTKKKKPADPGPDTSPPDNICDTLNQSEPVLSTIL